MVELLYVYENEELSRKAL